MDRTGPIARIRAHTVEATTGIEPVYAVLQTPSERAPRTPRSAIRAQSGHACGGPSAGVATSRCYQPPISLDVRYRRTDGKNSECGCHEHALIASGHKRSVRRLSVPLLRLCDLRWDGEAQRRPLLRMRGCARTRLDPFAAALHKGELLEQVRYRRRNDAFACSLRTSASSIARWRTRARTRGIRCRRYIAGFGRRFRTSSNFRRSSRSSTRFSSPLMRIDGCKARLAEANAQAPRPRRRFGAMCSACRVWCGLQGSHISIDALRWSRPIVSRVQLKSDECRPRDVRPARYASEPGRGPAIREPWRPIASLSIPTHRVGC